jgi:hypothetical protein
MDKLKRTRKNYGGGTGKDTYKSDLFSVTRWKLAKGIKTTIRNKLHWSHEISFDGDIVFDNDAACISQFTPKEILGIIGLQKKEAFKAGEESNARKIHKALGI